MIGGKKHSVQMPSALGSMLQASTYGMTIPQIMGLTKSPLLAIWAQNLRQGGSGKKGKKKKHTPTYIENIDFLIGHNPIFGCLQGWQNTTKYPLNFTSYTVSVVTGGTGTVVIPDAEFYAVVGVTATITYSYSFNDYGGSGPSSGSGTYEVPLWNTEMTGPDPTNGSAYQNYPYVYTWSPAQGTTVYFPSNPLVAFPVGSLSAFTIYYAQLSSATKLQSPLARLRLTFEPTLGDGTEYGTAYAAQQILYPWYAGAGSADFDLGAGGVIADTRIEVQGAYGLYKTGDCDFADMIQDVVKSGVAQADLASEYNLSPIQHGVGCYDYPGPVQKKDCNSYIHNINNLPLVFDLPNVEGNILVASYFSGNSSATTPTISDDAGNTWITIDAGNGVNGSVNYAWGVWYCIAKAYPVGNTVHIGNQPGLIFDSSMTISEWPFDSFDTVTAQTISANTGNTEISIPFTSSNARGNPESILAFFMFANSYSGTPILSQPYWKSLFTHNPAMAAQWRTVRSPGTFTLNDTLSGAGGNIRAIIFGLKQSAPTPYPMPLSTMLGNIIDDSTLYNARLQCRAGGLWGSVSMSSQKEARDWLKDFYSSMNSAPVWSGFVLKSIARSEVSAFGNGAVYTAPTSSGPVANLSDVNGDFIGSKDEPPITVDRASQVTAPDILQYQTVNRSSDYNPVVTSQPEASGVSLYGVRKAAPEVHNEIQDVTVARKLLAIQVRRNAYLRNSYKFKLTAKWKLLEPMDLITITDTLAGISALPVRLTSIEEDDKYNLDCEAELFVYGTHAPDPLTATDAQPNLPNPNADPGSVNTPIIFEPVPRLFNSDVQRELWIVASGANANYGGYLVLLSTDGGTSYNPLGDPVVGNGVTGFSVGDWPIGSDPDTTHDLSVDLTESLGTLSSYALADENNFTYPCYVAGGNASIPYALMTYAVANLTAANKYTLKATGGGTNQLRRCVYGAPTIGTDVDHPNNSRFAFLGNPAQNNQPGVFRITMDPKWIGVTLYFKLLAFNTFQSAIQDQTAATAYTFTPTGTPGAQPQPGTNNYGQSPSISLSQTTATNIAMAQTTETFGPISVRYNARNFTIADPGGTPTTYYVTIADPGMVGDTGSGTNLTATCQASQALVGVPGNTYIGSIIANHTPASAVPGPGGNPPQQTFLVNGS